MNLLSILRLSAVFTCLFADLIIAEDKPSSLDSNDIPPALSDLSKEVVLPPIPQTEPISHREIPQNENHPSKNAESRPVHIKSMALQKRKASDKFGLRISLDSGEHSPAVMEDIAAVLAKHGLKIEIEHPIARQKDALLKYFVGLAENFASDYASVIQKQTDKKIVRVLSLDGGGIRGVMLLVFLRHLEKITGKSIHELFDLIVATSTGSLIACGLTCKKIAEPPHNAEEARRIPKADEKPYQPTGAYYTPEEILRIYRYEGPLIFSDTPSVFKPSSWAPWRSPRYVGGELERIIKKYFGGFYMSDLDHNCETMITAFDYSTKKLIKFSSMEARESNSNENVLLETAMNAAVRAPTVFNPVRDPRTEHPIGDGALWYNNPLLFGVFEAAKKHGVHPHEVFAVSLGTGHCLTNQTLAQYENFTVYNWADELLNTLFDGQNIDHLAKDFYQLYGNLGSDPKYYRISPKIPPNLMKMDEVSLPNFQALEAAAEETVRIRDNDFKRIATVIGGGAPLISIAPPLSKAAPLSVDSAVTAEINPAISAVISGDILLPSTPAIPSPPIPMRSDLATAPVKLDVTAPVTPVISVPTSPTAVTPPTTPISSSPKEPSPLLEVAKVEMAA